MEFNDGHGGGVGYGAAIDRIITALSVSHRVSAGWVFTAVNIPQGATITAAYVSLHLDTTFRDDVYGLMYGNDVDSANNFQNEAVLFSRTRTTATLTWNQTGLGTGWKNTPDLTSIVQEIINRPGWAANNDMCILGIATFYGFADITLSFHTYDYDPTLAPKLHIEYAGAPPAGGACYGYIIS